MGVCAQARVHRHVEVRGQLCGVSAVATIHILGMYVGVCCRVTLPCHTHYSELLCPKDGFCVINKQPKAHRTLCT